MAIVNFFGTITITVKQKDREPLNVALEQVAYMVASVGFADYVISGSFSYKEDAASLTVAATEKCGQSLDDCVDKISKRAMRSLRGRVYTVGFSAPEPATKI